MDERWKKDGTRNVEARLTSGTRIGKVFRRFQAEEYT